VGSEMCIRDRPSVTGQRFATADDLLAWVQENWDAYGEWILDINGNLVQTGTSSQLFTTCVIYTAP